jgi:hypothetical protein
MPITTVQDANSIRGMSRCTRYKLYVTNICKRLVVDGLFNMFGEYHSLCTLKTSIVDFGKEKEHCIRYKSQNVWFLLKSPHMPSFKTYCAYFVFYNISHISRICSLLLNGKQQFLLYVCLIYLVNQCL